MKKKLIIPFAALLVVLLLSFSVQEANRSRKMEFVPDKGFVPDSATAVKIAEDILVPVYGKKQIDSESPLRASLSADGAVWTVSGTLPKGWLGGVAKIEIQKSDCKILLVEHGK